MSTLILTLPLPGHGDPTAYSYALTADGHSALRQGSAAPALLPEPSRPGGEVVAVVPVRALSWQRVNLPRGLNLGAGQQTQRLRSVLEGLLEERLLDETSALHFALEPGAQTGAPMWVAVCDRNWLHTHLQALEAAGRRVVRIVPEFAPGATTSAAAELCVLGTPEDAHIVLSGQGPDRAVNVLPLSPLVLSLVQGQPAADGTDTRAGDAAPAPTLRADPAVAALAERTLGLRAELATTTQRALDAARGPWDLAQLELASTGRTRAMRQAGSAVSAWLYAPQWRAARWGAALLVLAHLIGLNAWAWQERQSLAAKQASVRATFTQTFPQIPVVIDAPLQMAREVARLRQSAGSVSTRDLEPLLAAAGSALPAGQSPSAIEFTPGELRLRGLSLTDEQQSSAASRLQAVGIQARLDDGSWLLRAVESTP